MRDEIDSEYFFEGGVVEENSLSVIDFVREGHTKRGI